jgi:hypothetical protein
MTTINCPGCARRLSLPKDALGQVSRCPKCGTQFTARETVDRLGSTLTVQPQGAGDGPWFGGPLHEAEAAAGGQAPAGPPPGSQEPPGKGTPGGEGAWPGWGYPPATTPPERPAIPAPWIPPPPAPQGGGGGKGAVWGVVLVVAVVSAVFRSRPSSPPPAIQPPHVPMPLEVPAVPQFQLPNWQRFAGTWQDAQGSRLTINFLGGVHGKLLDPNGGPELKVGLENNEGKPATQLQRGPQGDCYLDVVSVNALGGVERCRLTFRLEAGGKRLEIVETPDGPGPAVRTYRLTRAWGKQAPPQGVGDGPDPP